QQEAQSYVLEHLEKLFLKPAFSRRRLMNPDHPLSAAELEALKRRIEFQPHLFVAQERVERSTAPCVTVDGVAPRRISLRVYLVASNGSYNVMPGGLTRVAPTRDSRSVSMQRGGASKDT